jgi:hypothetical protein
VRRVCHSLPNLPPGAWFEASPVLPVHEIGQTDHDEEKRQPVGAPRTLDGPPCARTLLTLTAKTQFLDHRPVAFEIVLLQVLEESSAASDHLEEAASAMVVFGMGPEVLGELLDPRRELRDLNGR